MASYAPAACCLPHSGHLSLSSFVSFCLSLPVPDPLPGRHAQPSLNFTPWSLVSVCFLPRSFWPRSGGSADSLMKPRIRMWVSTNPSGGLPSYPRCFSSSLALVCIQHGSAACDSRKGGGLAFKFGKNEDILDAINHTAKNEILKVIQRQALEDFFGCC